MSIISAIGATGERGPVVWAFSVTGIIVGGVVGAVLALGVTLGLAAGNFAVTSLWTFVGWVLGASVGGSVGLLGGNIVTRLRGAGPEQAAGRTATGMPRSH